MALVVDDDGSCRKLLRLLLTAQGFRVLSAGDGKKALGVCSRHRLPIDIVITDIEMPGMSGLELADSLAEIRPTLPVLFVSGGAECRPSEHKKQGQIRLYLRKPLSLADLISAIEAISS